MEMTPDLLLMVFHPEHPRIRARPSPRGDVTLTDGFQECYFTSRQLAFQTDANFGLIRAELGMAPVSWLEVTWFCGDDGKDCADDALAELAMWRPLVVWEQQEQPQFLRPGHIPRHLV